MTALSDIRDYEAQRNANLYADSTAWHSAVGALSVHIALGKPVTAAVLEDLLLRCEGHGNDQLVRNGFAPHTDAARYIAKMKADMA